MDQHIITLLGKYMNQQCSKAELEQVISILEAGTHEEEWEFALTQDANQVLEKNEELYVRNEVAVVNLHNRMIKSLRDQNKSIPLNANPPGWKFIYGAAAAIILLLSGWWLFKSQFSNSALPKDQIVQQDIAPGRFGATLTLGSGKSITLEGSKSGVVIAQHALSYNDGSEVSATSSASATEMYRASTDIGNTYMFTLPDGTKVWLNAASQLSFPSKFNSQNRLVGLRGEAYFQVAKDKDHPFIVESKGQQVKVLGTHFNINSYADEKTTKTTLLEGSVRLLTSSLRGAGSAGAILKPGQQSSLNADGILMVSNVDTALATAWKNNKFIFENNDIQSVMRMVQRWYNVEVIYSRDLPDATFGGKISRFSNISNVLRLLETTGGVHFKVEDRKIYVSK